MELNKSQIDKLGDKLRQGSFSDDDLRILDTYRRSFTAAYEEVISRIVSELGLAPTGRPAKSTTSIIEKLQRETIRLSQMQDIAGCRIVVTNITSQDEAVERLSRLFAKVLAIDRRENPSHGYRAFHLIVEESVS